MSEKKKPGRFTLQFSLEDPQQRTVSKLLERQGRHKAQFLTSAVLHYMQYPKPQEHSGGLAGIDEAILERMLLSIMEKNPQLTAALSSSPSESKMASALTAPATGPWDASMGSDALKAIADTLAEFQGGRDAT